MKHELKKHELKKSVIYKEQLLKLNPQNSIEDKEKKENKEINYKKKIVDQKDIATQKEIIPIIDGTHVNRLPRFWQTDRPWTVGFSGGKCEVSDFLVLINSAPKNLNFRQVQRQYLMRQSKRFKMKLKLEVRDLRGKKTRFISKYKSLFERKGLQFLLNYFLDTFLLNW